ncbi:hypothetical protein EHZ19_15865 [Paraburkholderia bannensis]|nr:hypothetical protein [Paraburkholderia bannensis]RQM47129.1 hypothetical protein EHZ19_15865 [Paraburkholderia bannensis]
MSDSSSEKINRPLFRQVHPSWIQNGRPSSQTFQPTPKDENKLSVYDSDLISAQDSHTYHTQTLNLKSDGVLAVTVADVSASGRTFTLDGIPIAAHGYIDFQGLSGGQSKKVAQNLLRLALEHPWAYQRP